MLQRPNRLTRTMLWCAFATTVCAAPAAAADVTGDWRVKDGTAIIRVADCDGAMWGVVAWEKVPGGSDTNNPDTAKRTRPFLGMPVLLDMKRGEEPGEWEGHVYNAKNGKTYESKIHLVSPDQLEIEGCVLGFLCGGETWTRVAQMPPGPVGNSAMAPAQPTAKASPKAPPPKAHAKTPAKSQGKTTGSTNPPVAENDPVGDVCLLPDIARGAH